jgi:hypothetical protein
MASLLANPYETPTAPAVLARPSRALSWGSDVCLFEKSRAAACFCAVAQFTASPEASANFCRYNDIFVPRRLIADVENDSDVLTHPPRIMTDAFGYFAKSNKSLQSDQPDRPICLVVVRGAVFMVFIFLMYSGYVVCAPPRAASTGKPYSTAKSLR